MMRVGQYELSYTSDLKQYGLSCDGHPFIGEVFYVTATDDAGNVWVLKRSFDGCLAHYDDEGYAQFEDRRPWAGAACRTMIARIAEVGVINLAHWVRGDPVYGSEAYIAYGQADQVAREKAQ